MTIRRMDHVGIVVDDLAAATEFFVELGLELQGEGRVEGRWVDRVVGLDGVRAEIAMLQTADGTGDSSWRNSTRRRPRAATGTRPDRRLDRCPSRPEARVPRGVRQGQPALERRVARFLSSRTGSTRPGVTTPR
jgi:catechol 2,3-dioxygenase-like lactoylglutathione lyase family enzyme